MSNRIENLEVKCSCGNLVCTIDLEFDGGYGQEFICLTLGDDSKLLSKIETSENYEEHYLIKVNYKAVMLTIFQSASDGNLYFDSYELKELTTGNSYLAALSLIEAAIK